MDVLPKRKLGRRKFISNSIKTAALLPLSSTSLLSHEKIRKREVTSSPRKLNILILGGTSFLGPHQIAYALDRGHKISTFTRGKTIPKINTDRFKEVEALVGDREDNLEALKNRKWDVVLDNSGRKVSWTKSTAELLKDNVELYLYVSSVSVYYPYYNKILREPDELVRKIPTDIEDGEERLYDYGIMKANSEQAAIDIFGEDRSIVVRPTFMMGPGDRTDRFVYFPTQLAKGGDIIVPGKMNDRVQYIDIRDIASWMIRLAEDKSTGIYNGVGPASPTTVLQYVYGCHAAFNSKINYVHINDYEFLKSNDMSFVTPWVLEEGKFAGMMGADNARALESGLTFRPLAETAYDINQWWYSDAVSKDRRNKYHNASSSMHNRQAGIIEKWKKQNG